jgi:hypothetical protein
VEPVNDRNELAVSVAVMGLRVRGRAIEVVA